jgi:DNA replication protein DnaC
MAICNNIMEFHKVGVVYMPYREEITRIKQTVTDEINYNNAIGRFKNAPVLMIDDLLKGKNSEADVNILFEIINFRYLNNMPMVISTEKTIDELLSFDEGTMSRVIEMARGHQIEILGREYNYRLYGD